MSGPPTSWQTPWRSLPLGWSLSTPSSTGLTAARLIERSLRSQPRSDLAGRDHIVLVVLQYSASRSRAHLSRVPVHRFGEPHLRVQPSRIVVSPAEAHMSCHQLEPEAADAEVVRLDNLQQ